MSGSYSYRSGVCVSYMGSGLATVIGVGSVLATAGAFRSGTLILIISYHVQKQLIDGTQNYLDANSLDGADSTH